MFKLSQRSMNNLVGVHGHLVDIMERSIAITKIDFVIIEGVRTLERQRELVAKGASKTMNSRHLTGHAIDIVPLFDGQISWRLALYDELIPYIKAAARDCRYPVECGHDWKKFRDSPHIQLPWKQYP